MEYPYLQNHIAIRAEFIRRFTMPYGAFCQAHADWLASLPMSYRREYTMSYYERLPYSDRLTPDFQVLPFEAALEQLRQMPLVYFLTCEPGGLMCDHAVYGSEQLWAAQAPGPELARAIREDWFRMYELWEQEMYDPEPLFASELYAFTPDYTKAIIFTHETDETELPETRICLSLNP